MQKGVSVLKDNVWNLKVKKTKDSDWEIVNESPMTYKELGRLRKKYQLEEKYYALESDADLPFKDGGGVESYADLYGGEVFLISKGYDKIHTVYSPDGFEPSAYKEGIKPNGDVGIYFYTELPTVIEKKDLEKMSKDYEGKNVELFTNAGVDLHSSAKGVFKNITIHRLKIKYAKGGVTDFIENSESIKNNGYYSHIKNLDLFVGANTTKVPHIKSLVLLTFNSGGQKDLKVSDTINSIELSRKIAELLNVEIDFATVLVHEHMTSSIPFETKSINVMNNENIIVADRDNIVHTNINDSYAEGGSIGFVPMDLEEDLRIIAKWGGTNIKGVIGFLNAMIDSGLTDSDLLSNPSKNTRFQRERAEEKKIQEIWNKIEPNYKGGLKGNMYYSTIKKLVQRANRGDDILKRFKPFRKLQKDSYAFGGGVGEPYDSMTKYQIEKEYKKLNEKRDLLKNKYRDFKSDEILENEKEIDKIITLLYGKDFSGIGQKFRYAEGGGVAQFPPKGELTNKDNFLLKYEKRGGEYEFLVYKPITKEVSGYNQIKHVCLNKDCPQKMTYDQFINYLYAELYLDDNKYADGGSADGDYISKMQRGEGYRYDTIYLPKDLKEEVESFIKNGYYDLVDDGKGRLYLLNKDSEIGKQYEESEKKEIQTIIEKFVAKGKYADGGEIEPYDDEKYSSEYDYLKKIITKQFGEQNMNYSSADWGGLDNWTIKGGMYEGIFIIIDDDRKVILMERKYNEELEENEDTDILYAEVNDKSGLQKLFNMALQIKYPLNNYADGGETGDGAKYEVTLKSDKHYGQIGFTHYGIESDNRGFLFVSLEFPNGVNTYAMDEVKRVYADGGGVDDEKMASDMTISELNDYIDEKYIPEIEDAELIFSFSETGFDYDIKNDESKIGIISYYEQQSDYNQESLEKNTIYKVNGWEIVREEVDPETEEVYDSSELEELTSDNTYNFSYLGMVDLNWRMYYDDIYETYFIIMHPHLGGDPRGNYGKPFIIQGDDKDELISRFYSEFISGTIFATITLKDGSVLKFDSEQESMNYRFNFEEYESEINSDLAQELVNDFESFQTGKGDEFIEEIIDGHYTHSGKSKKYRSGGGVGLDDAPSIYVEILGTGEGKWMSLEGMSDGDEVMTAIQEFYDELNEEDGGSREEYRIADMEGFGHDVFYSEYMSESDFDDLLEAYELFESSDYPYGVVRDYANEKGIELKDAIESMSDSYYGAYGSLDDFAYQMISEGVYTPSIHEVYVTDTDKRIISGEEADNYVSGMSNDEIISYVEKTDEYQETLDDLQGQLDELESEKESIESSIDLGDEKDIQHIQDLLVDKEEEIELLEEKIDNLESEFAEELKDEAISKRYDEVYSELDNNLEGFLQEYGYENYTDANFVVVDYKEVADNLKSDYSIFEDDGKYYIFIDYKNGGKIHSVGTAKDYNYYVVETVSNKIISGHDSKKEANEHKAELKKKNNKLKLVAYPRSVVEIKYNIDTTSNKSFANIESFKYGGDVALRSNKKESDYHLWKTNHNVKEKVNSVVDKSEKFEKGGDVNPVNINRPRDKKLITTHRALRNVAEPFKKSGSWAKRQWLEADFGDGTGGAKFEGGGDVEFIKYNGEEIMYSPHFETYFVNDSEFETLEEAKEFIDKGSPTPDWMKDAYRKGLFNDGGQIEPKLNFGDFKETLQEYEIEGGFGKSMEKGFEMYYLPNDSKFLKRKFKHRDKIKAYKEYLELYKSMFEKTSKDYESGGSIESQNKAMLENDAVQIEHHSEELNKVVPKTKEVPAWVIGKTSRINSDLSDVAHYLDGEVKRKGKYSVGGAIYPDLSLRKADVVNDSIVLDEFQIKKMKNTFKIDGIENTKISSSNDAVKILRKIFGKDTINAYEQAFVLYLNKDNKVIGYYHHSSGGIDGTVMDVQMISGMALKSLAKGVIIAHNHPSENTNPSEADKRITTQLKDALKLFNILLLDSIILTDNSFRSFADEGLIFSDGGTLELPIDKAHKVFHLPLESSIYVPSTINVNETISPDELQERVDQTKEFLGNLFGGYTSNQAIGGFVDSKGELVNEDVVKVTSFAEKETFNKHKETLLKQLSKWAKEWGQEAIGYEFEGDLYYVPENYANGGSILKK